jgi:peptidoglycan/LPS O-acetylase OafA/YrhL
LGLVSPGFAQFSARDCRAGHSSLERGSMIKPRGIPSMTGIRGIAALWVLLFHAQQDADKIFNLRFLQRIPGVQFGWHGVDLFFMLSGFILMHAHARDFFQFRRDSLIRFARLRFTRVYPLNAVVLLLIAAFVPFQPGFVAWSRSIFGPSTFSAGAFVRTLFLATRWFLPGSGDWNQPVWSLSLEVLGYLAFPFLAFSALRIGKKWQLAGLACLCLVASTAILTRFAFQGEISQIAVVRMASCFITGIALYRLWILSAESGKRWAAWIAAVSVGLLAVSAAGLLYRFFRIEGDFQFNFLFAALLYSLAFQQGIVNAILASRVAVFFGEISFPLYLVHVEPLLWLRYFMISNGASYSTLQKALALLGWAAGCILVATLLHYFVEKPFHAWGRSWAGARVP